MTELRPYTQPDNGGCDTETVAISTAGTGAVKPTAQSRRALDAKFTRIYEAEVGFVWNRLRRLGVAERDLEDKVHDVFVVVHRHLAEFDGSRPLRPWLAGISVRVAIDHHRQAHQRRVLLKEVEEVDHGKGPDSILEEKQAHDQVMAALDSLPLDQRTVFVLKEVEGFSMPEIEEMLDAPLNTLYSRLRLARERFSAAVQQLREREGAR